MKVYLLQDVEKVGMAGQIVTVAEGFAMNFLLPRKMASKVSGGTEAMLAQRSKKIQIAGEAIQTKMGMLAERIKNMHLSLKKRVHDDGKLYGSVSAEDIVDLLKNKDVAINKKQVVFNKNVRAVGEHKVAIKLSSKLQPELTLTVAGE